MSDRDYIDHLSYTSKGRYMRHLKFLLFCVVTSLSAPAMSACLSGYKVLGSETGVEMCGSGDIVIQTIDLSKGAGIKSLYNEPVLDKEGIELFYKMDTAGFTLKSFSIVNGQYFDGNKYFDKTTPVKLAHPVKEHGKVITKGYLNDKFIATSGNFAYISTDTKSYSSYSQVIGGKAKGARPGELSGRNLAGVSSDGKKIIILIAKSLTDKQAESLIKQAGASNFIHLDGSGSARLASSYKNIPSSDGRLIPHAIGVLSKSQNDASVKIDKCINTYSSYFGKKLGSLHSDCGGNDVAEKTLFCQSTDAGKKDITKARKIAVSTNSSSQYFYHYVDSKGWQASKLSLCK